jgi:aryl-alcohol dehydrogenase-like predicted oxidoreductase
MPTCVPPPRKCVSRRSDRLQTRRLGRNGPEVSALGLGCMGMSGSYGPADDSEGIATIQAALDAGITMLDTGDFYGMGHNELLLREALKGGRRDHAFIAVKFGALRGPDGSWQGLDTRPAAVKNFLAHSLSRLGTDHIDLYQPARLDHAVPIEDTIGAIADLVKTGYVRHIGLSEMSAATIRRAHAVHPISALQIEYSLFTRGIEDEILPTLRELGIGLVPYGVLARGLLSDTFHGARPLSGQTRTRMPRFQGENLTHNLALADALRAIAREKGLTLAQLAIAWVRARGDEIVPIVGARRRGQLAEILGALEVGLTADDLARIERAVPPGAARGERYAPAQMAELDSERKMANSGART